ncbi:hypothetical protein pb186bvf_009921 [Paramecium bursaria]
MNDEVIDIKGFWDTNLLIVRFSFDLSSLLAYLYMIYLITRFKMLNQISVQLIFSQAIIQITLLYIPFLLASIFSGKEHSSDDPEFVDHGFCQYQGFSITIGWLGGNFLSLWASIYTFRMLNGEKRNRKLFFKILTILLIVGITTATLIATLGKYESFFLLFRGRPYYGFCSNDNKVYLVFEFLFQLFCQGYMIYIYCFKINKIQNKLIQAGIQVDNILIQIQYAGISQISIWSINMITKFFNYYFTDFINTVFKYYVLDLLIWQPLNLLFDLEGVYMIFLFVRLYRTFLDDSFSIFVNKLINYVDYKFFGGQKKDEVFIESNCEDFLDKDDERTLTLTN